jgi:hypothetical protein
MKRVIAVCGVWLTFVSCMQQTHAWCAMSGCQSANKHTEVRTACSCIAKRKCRASCGSGHGRRPDDAGGTSVNQNAGRAAYANLHDAPSKPCRREGACCVPPSPQQAPTPLDADFLTQPVAAEFVCQPSAPLRDALGAECSGSAEWTPLRAIDACVRLCRFLV